jgi:hypothetical protein
VTDKLAPLFVALRKDAMERGMLDLALVYGWSAMRCYNEEIVQHLRLLKQSARPAPDHPQ